MLGLVELILAKQSRRIERLEGTKERHERNNKKPVTEVWEALHVGNNRVEVSLIDHFVEMLLESQRQRRSSGKRGGGHRGSHSNE